MTHTHTTNQSVDGFMDRNNIHTQVPGHSIAYTIRLLNRIIYREQHHFKYSNVNCQYMSISYLRVRSVRHGTAWHTTTDRSSLYCRCPMENRFSRHSNRIAMDCVFYSVFFFFNSKNQIDRNLKEWKFYFITFQRKKLNAIDR